MLYYKSSDFFHEDFLAQGRDAADQTERNGSKLKVSGCLASVKSCIAKSLTHTAQFYGAVVRNRTVSDVALTGIFVTKIYRGNTSSRTNGVFKLPCMLQEVSAPRIRMIDVGSMGKPGACSLANSRAYFTSSLRHRLTRANQPARKPFWQKRSESGKLIPLSCGSVRSRGGLFWIWGSNIFHCHFHSVLRHISLDPMHVLCVKISIASRKPVAGFSFFIYQLRFCEVGNENSTRWHRNSYAICAAPEKLSWDRHNRE